MLADSSNRRSWNALSRTRYAMGILLTALGVPRLFMGQEFLEDKQWTWDSHTPNLLYWAGMKPGVYKKMEDYHRCTQDLIRLHWNQSALRGDNVHALHVYNQSRVIAYHCWPDSGFDVVVVATLSNPPGAAIPLASHNVALGLRQSTVMCMRTGSIP